MENKMRWNKKRPPPDIFASRTTKRTRLSDTVKEPYLPKITGDTLEIQVGPLEDMKTFLVHRSVLNSSRFFQNCTKKEWATKAGTPVRFPGESRSAFETYVQWLYSRNIPTKQSAVLIYAYALGEMLMDDEFQNAILASIIQDASTKRHYMNAKLQNVIYNSTSKGSPARRFVVDCYVWYGTPSWLEKKDPAQDFHPELVNDIIAALLSSRASLGLSRVCPWLSDPEAYLETITQRREAAK